MASNQEMRLAAHLLRGLRHPQRCVGVQADAQGGGALARQRGAHGGVELGLEAG